jgi:hypothetical protein
MKRITCRVCKKRRIPWWKKWRGDAVVGLYRSEWIETEIKIRPLSPYICTHCIEEML